MSIDTFYTLHCILILRMKMVVLAWLYSYLSYRYILYNTIYSLQYISIDWSTIITTRKVRLIIWCIRLLKIWCPISTTAVLHHVYSWFMLTFYFCYSKSDNTWNSQWKCSLSLNALYKWSLCTLTISLG